MLQKIPIALVQVKSCSTSEYLLNKIRQIKYSLYRSKEITKKVYNNIINCIIQKWMLYLWILKIANIWSSQTITQSYR